MKTRSLAAVLMVVFVYTGPSWSGEIRETVSKFPSNLDTPLGPQSNTVQKFTGIACYDARNGMLQDCGFDMTVVGLTPPASDVANNGGHNHDFAAHPAGKLSIVAPIVSGPSAFLAGQTAFDVFVVSHAIPEVSGKVDTLLNLRVPPGWHTVSPESCDGSGTSWCFRTTIDIGVPGLMSLPDGPFYVKVRGGAPNHEDSAAYSGTADAIFKLIEIADEYSDMTTRLLSINDMSLPRGGLFDIDSSYSAPHRWHRVGQSADINKALGTDCRNAYDLIVAVNFVMPAEAGSFFARRGFPSAGRFLCEPNGNIHIDFDVIPPPPPSPFQ